MLFSKPGQYRVYIISWLPLIVGSLLLATSCFFVGRWTSHAARYNDTAIKKEIADLQKEAQAAPKEIVPHQDDTMNRLALMTCVNNENFAAIQAGKPQDVLFINRDWKINRLPKYLDMTKADKEWMMQFIEAAPEAPPQVPKR